MYFLFFILRGWGKRSAVQPKPACSGLPYKEKGCKTAQFPYLLLLLVRWSEYCLMEEILLSDSDMNAFSFSSNSWSAVLGAAGCTGVRGARFWFVPPCRGAPPRNPSVRPPWGR